MRNDDHMGLDYPELPPSVDIKEEPGVKGRGLFASTAIKKGTTLVRATPLVSTYDIHSLLHFCWSCGQETSPSKPLKQCTGCKVAQYCSAACQKANWVEVHKLECPALKRYAASHTSDRPELPVAVPETPVRVLAQILWKKSLQDSRWWAQISSMQSHRTRLPLEHLERFGHLALRLSEYIGPNYVTGLQGAEELLDLVCSMASNAFSLATPDLSNIGVAVSPVIALANHSCEPNAVVVFPHGAKKKDGMHLVVLQDIAQGEEILTSYVDLSMPRARRQKEIYDRYRFDCQCMLCSRRAQRPAWVDPRESLKCPTGKCSGLAALPDLDNESDQQVRCNHCKHEWTVSGKDLAEQMRVGEATIESLEKSNGTGISDHLKTCVKAFSTDLADSSHFLFALLRAAQLAFIDDGLFNDAMEVSQRITKAMALLYPPCHPVVLIQMVTMAKLIQNTMGNGANDVAQLFLAQAALKSALTGFPIGYGAGSVVQLEASQLLDDVQMTLRHLQVSRAGS